ncbi:MAG: hypothetical protein J5710_02485 [Treponema sp.]|nr:hypothetical protein [Treponema sp.]MBR5645145.1 hypothetical protein [Treponema sp.]
MKSFIVCINSTVSWYKENDLYETLKKGETTPVGMALKYKEGSQIEQGDLVFAVKVTKTKASLVAVGKAITDYDEDPDIEGILIQIDFIKKKRKEFQAFSTLINEAGIIITQDMYEILLAPDFTEKLLKSFAIQNMTHFTPCYIHDPNINQYQLICDYLNDYCPKFRQEVIKRFPLVYKNYKEGEVIDKDTIDLTYTQNIYSAIATDLDWDILFEIVRPRA